MQKPSVDDVSYSLRPGGAQHRQTQYVIGNFPMGVPAALKGDITQWKLHRDKITAAPSRRRNYVQPDAAPWLLEDRKGAITHKGQLEGGIATDNYFVLMKNSEGFTVLPVKSWYTFKPPPRRTAMSLEEAEAEMEKKHSSHFSGAGRLTQAIAKAEAEGLDGGPDEGGALGADSDEEQKRANRAKAASADQSSRVEARKQNNNADVNMMKGDKAAEDWEYEENAADDDDDMGEQEDVNNRDASPSPRRSPTSAAASSPTASAEDEGDEGQGLSKQGRELQRLLKTTGLSESDNEEDARENNSLMTDDEDEDEVEDLDALAKGMESRPTSAAAKPPSALAASRKRSPTPTSAAGKASTKRKADSGAVPAAKRQRSVTPMSQALSMDAKPAMAGGVKVEPTSSPSVKTETTAVKSEGPITMAEVHDFVAKLGGTIPATDLTKHFKTRLITREDKDHFRHIVKTGLTFNKATKSLGLAK